MLIPHARGLLIQITSVYLILLQVRYMPTHKICYKHSYGYFTSPFVVRVGRGEWLAHAGRREGAREEPRGPLPRLRERDRLHVGVRPLSASC